ncbi:MAG: CoA transferase [Chloroflexota bacterium]|nr:CoA transferase [Chloroflexota bacterium]
MAKALEGLKIADFTWVITGPLSTKWLANLGATVVRVESNKRLGLFRTYVPMAGGVVGVNRCGTFAEFNDSKYGMLLNLEHPQSRDVMQRLISWADVVVENFRPGVLDKLGWSYEELRKIKPEIIMARASMYGQTGSLATVTGFGTILQAHAGFTNLVGWPDRPPTGYSIAYTDTPSASYLAIGILAALDYRRRTGQGTYIDLSQFEAGLSLIAPCLMDYTVNGRITRALGNRHSYASPHGAFPCKGDDRWCVITVFSDAQWQALCQVMGEPVWSKELRFSTFLERKRSEDELEKLIAAWTVNYTPEEIMKVLQDKEIPAGIVREAYDLLDEDDQVEYRKSFKPLNHVEIGPFRYQLPPFILSETPPEIEKPFPCLGEHTEFVCREFLGMPDEEFVEFLAQGVFE